MKPGISKISMPEYLSIRALSSGMVHTLLTQSPAHALHQQLADIDDPSTPSERGTAIHDALLEGVDRCVLVEPELHRSKPTKADPEGAIPKGWTNGAMREARAAARAEGKIPLLPDDYDNVLSAAHEARTFVERSSLRGVFDGAEPELTFIWDEGKARPDLINRAMRVCLHLKTTDGSAAPGPFGRTADNCGYDLALCFYERGVAACGLEDYRHLILAVEQNAPYGCALYDLSPAKASIASSRVDRAIRTWQQCVTTNHWPAYDTRVHSLEPTVWQLNEEEAAQIGGAFDPAVAGEL